MKISIGAVAIHRTGTNPYHRDETNPYASGPERVKALKVFKDTGKLPEGFSAWDDGHRVPITAPDEINWDTSGIK